VASLIFDDVVDVVMIMTILSMSVVVSYLPPRIIISQSFIAAG
jgi:hypothetical protein